MEKLLFKERQSGGRNKWLFNMPLAFICSSIIGGYLFLRWNYNSGGFNKDDFLTLNFIIPAAITFAVILVVAVVNSKVVLTTKFYSNRIIINYFRLKHKVKRINSKDIVSYKIRKYSAYREYRGYGIKRNAIRGKAYIISGEVGLQLVLKDGSRILVGTQKKQAIKYAMEKLMNKRK